MVIHTLSLHNTDDGILGASDYMVILSPSEQSTAADLKGTLTHV